MTDTPAPSSPDAEKLVDDAIETAISHGVNTSTASARLQQEAERQLRNYMRQAGEREIVAEGRRVQIVSLKAAYKALRGEIAALKAALEPFAAEARSIAQAEAESGVTTPDDMNVEAASIAGTPLTVGDLRRAAAALAAPDVGEGSDWVLVPKRALDWLNGAGPDHEGHGFGTGEVQFGNGKRYWWRNRFRAVIKGFAAVSPTGEKP